MKISKAQNLACPIDGVQLQFNEQQLVCENGHGFDVARQGYVNLLPVQHKRSKQPGDSKEMVIARSQFLNTGVYHPIAEKLADMTFALISEYDQVTNNEPVCLMDAGCGEGYYLNSIFNDFNNKDAELMLSFIGLDISKHAILESAKRNKQITWIVGTNRQPPVCAESVDIVLCVFGFQSFDGFYDVLKPGGKVVLVEPGSDHLQELRAIIYSDVKKAEPANLAYLEPMGFSMMDSQSLQFKTDLISNQQINNLLLMTPHFYRAKKQGREAAGKLQELDLTVDAVFRVLQKTG